MRRVLVSVIAVALMVVSGLEVATAADAVLKVGVLGPMSGPAAQWGIELSRGAEIKAEEINAGGGLKVGAQTYKVEVVPYDHKGIAAEAITATNKLVSQDKVQYIVGNAIGATTSAAQTITEPAKVVFTFISYGPKALGPTLPFSFRTDLSDVEVVEPFYRWLKEQRPTIKRVAFFNPNDQSGKGAGARMVAAAKSLGLTVVADEYYEREAKDFYPVITRVLAGKPDFIDVGSSAPGSAGLIFKQLHEMGFRGGKGWISGVNPEAVVKIAGREATEGTLSPWSLSLAGPDATPAARGFAAKYQKKHGETPGSSAVANYIALDVITRAIQAAGSTDTEKVVQQMTSGKYESLWGPLVVGGKDTYGINRQFLRPITISEIRDGRAVDVAKTYPRDLK